MSRTIAILLLLAHGGAVAAPALAEARPSEAAPMSHCVPTVGHVGAAVTPASAGCDACDMPDCLGTASCAHAAVALISMTSIEFSPASESSSVCQGSTRVANLLHTPLPPPPKP